MNRRTWKLAAVPAMLAIALSVPSAVFAAEPQDEAGISASAEHPKGHYRRSAMGIVSASAHETMYLTLLSEKYSPESAAAWKEAAAERSRLRAEIRKLKESDGWRKLHDPDDDLHKEGVKPEEGKFEGKPEEKGKAGEKGKSEGKGKWWGDKSRSESKGKTGEKGKAEGKGKPEEKGKSEGKGSLQDERSEARESLRQVHEQFTKAVESGDAAQIKAALADFLPVYKQCNQHIARRLDEMKQKLSQA
ncbi:hypothetical protein ACFQWB_00205 [Paenibacillus thermoaerophilus]|uniref:Uncharacterized protein n=1 Tax=Paenibacillus thermoaerophilus TaxID=1215385 RepID=A0ABW2UWV2_9BACL|nr:hypothetical protein [Paenibacillus thermoaerophilus]TMV15885.1 hypothetical protein FE781_09850 [Paenibacillus thermoaerophilus]